VAPFAFFGRESLRATSGLLSACFACWLQAGVVKTTSKIKAFCRIFIVPLINYLIKQLTRRKLARKAYFIDQWGCFE
jgi:hypothetical protein